VPERICAAQVGSVWENPRATIETIEGYIRNASASGASLVCFPEQFATGWDPSSRLHIQGLSGEIVQTLRQLARKHHIAILGSFREQYRPLPRNTALVIDRQGVVIGVYAKCHLFSPGNEEQNYLPGEGIALFSLGDICLGMAICYDLRFSPLFRVYARQGADGVIVSSAWPASRVRAWELLIRARALEERLYIIGVNTTGITPVDTYCGNSIIAGPDGEVIARAGAGEELICATLDPAEIRLARASPPHVESDRRDVLYHALLRGAGDPGHP
jgi:omega-amidase